MIVTELENLQQYYGVCPALKKVKIYRLQLEVYQGLKLYGMLFVPEKVLEKNALVV